MADIKFFNNFKKYYGEWSRATDLHPTALYATDVQTATGKKIYEQEEVQSLEDTIVGIKKFLDDRSIKQSDFNYVVRYVIPDFGGGFVTTRNRPSLTGIIKQFKSGFDKNKYSAQVIGDKNSFVTCAKGNIPCLKDGSSASLYGIIGDYCQKLVSCGKPNMKKFSEAIYTVFLYLNGMCY